MADSDNNRIRRINLKTMEVTTVCGSGHDEDLDGPAFECSIKYPVKVWSCLLRCLCLWAEHMMSGGL